MSTTITWLDATKLFIPIFGSLIVSLIIFWAQTKFSEARERRQKKRFLYETVTDELPDLPKAITALDDIANKARLGHVRIRAFVLPVVRTEFATDLLRLDKKNAKLYAQFIGYNEICRSGFARLANLSEHFGCSHHIQDRERLKHIIPELTSSLIQDVIDLTVSELNLLLMISNTSRLNEDKVKSSLKQTRDDTLRLSGQVTQ